MREKADASMSEDERKKVVECINKQLGRVSRDVLEFPLNHVSRLSENHLWIQSLIHASLARPRFEPRRGRLFQRSCSKVRRSTRV